MPIRDSLRATDVTLVTSDGATFSFVMGQWTNMGTGKSEDILERCTDEENREILEAIQKRDNPMPNTHTCIYETPAGRFEGACDRRVRTVKRQLAAQNEQNALDALKRAVQATSHELYQLELTRAEDYIKAALADVGVTVEGRE